ncbi:MAG: hypothetical protein ACPG7F_11065 [Aggregatilineales bacterium]
MTETKHTCSVDHCNVEADVYLYPDDTSVSLCWDHAAGIFCGGCKDFIGGTEDIFIYGRFECSHCVGWVEDAMGRFDDYYDEEY